MDSAVTAKYNNRRTGYCMLQNLTQDLSQLGNTQKAVIQSMTVSYGVSIFTVVLTSRMVVTKMALQIPTPLKILFYCLLKTPSVPPSFSLLCTIYIVLPT